MKQPVCVDLRSYFICSFSKKLPLAKKLNPNILGEGAEKTQHLSPGVVDLLKALETRFIHIVPGIVCLYITNDPVA